MTQFEASLAALVVERLRMPSAGRRRDEITLSACVRLSSKRSRKRRKIATHRNWREKFEDVMGERMAIDATAASIERGIAEREQLRKEVHRLELALTAAYTELGGVKAERDSLAADAANIAAIKAEVFRLRRISDEADRAFDKGYDQAVHEICDHFRKQKDEGVTATIEKIWLKERS